MVYDDPKLPDDSGEVRKPNRVVGGLVPHREIVSLLDKILARWSSSSFVPKNQNTKIPKKSLVGHQFHRTGQHMEVCLK